MEKVKEITLKNPNESREKILIYKTYNYFHLGKDEEEVIQINSDKELTHYKKSAEIHNLDFSLDTRIIEDEEEFNEGTDNVYKVVEPDFAVDENDNEEEVSDEVEKDIEKEEEQVEEAEKEDEAIEEDPEVDEVQEEEPEVEEVEEVEEEEEVDELELLEEKLAEFDTETLQGLVDKFDITTYGATKKETLINKIIEQAEKLPQEFV